jgi:hypothetical protein
MYGGERREKWVMGTVELGIGIGVLSDMSDSDRTFLKYNMYDRNTIINYRKRL